MDGQKQACTEMGILSVLIGFPETAMDAYIPVYISFTAVTGVRIP
jgi:hypothetical protein